MRPTGRPQVQLGVFFLRWFMPQIVFYGVGAVAIGLLQAHRRFAAPMFAPILNNLVVIGTFVAYAIVRGDRPPRVGGHHHGRADRARGGHDPRA